MLDILREQKNSAGTATNGGTMQIVGFLMALQDDYMQKAQASSVQANQFKAA